jgi:hypothetical protein
MLQVFGHAGFFLGPRVRPSNFMFAADGAGLQKKRGLAANMKFERLTICVLKETDRE